MVVGNECAHKFFKDIDTTNYCNKCRIIRVSVNRPNGLCASCSIKPCKPCKLCLTKRFIGRYCKKHYKMKETYNNNKNKR